jgi:hypothetical protein
MDVLLQKMETVEFNVLLGSWHSKLEAPHNTTQNARMWQQEAKEF